MVLSAESPSEAKAGNSESSSTLVVPLLGSLLVTSAVLGLLWHPPLRSSLSLLGLGATALVYVMISAVVHTFVVWAVYRLFREHVHHNVWPLAVESWLSVVWVPLLVLLGQEKSVWVCLVVPLLVGNAGRFVEQNIHSLVAEADEAETPTARDALFNVEEGPPLWRVLLPLATIVLAAQGGVVAVWTGHPWSGGLLFATSALLARMRVLATARTLNLNRSRKLLLRSAVANSLIVLMLISMALTPFLRNTGRRAGLNFLGIKEAVPNRTMAATNSESSGTEYSGVVLLLPSKPRREVIPPKRIMASNIIGNPTKPIVIPFDGVYWYFKRPDKRPKRDAKVQHGDPLKENIRSTDRLPLLMAAHQALLSPIPVACCNALRVELTNADTRPGSIAVEVWVKETAARPDSVLFLGSVVIPSSTVRSISLTRAPINEVLTFHFPIASRVKSFDEITLLIKPAWERQLAGSNVAIHSFILVP